ncbi:hypothetical protein [Clostridioides difficile]|uniref:hypothetical protein n=1 Tax=Clostridioides difficile TaxID=1496 RepID=UPI0021D3B4EC|nr:hypothetical protein [Clostridioides difficile]MCU5873413.1 hypothetical protein [Clostridioides difficile]
MGETFKYVGSMGFTYHLVNIKCEKIKQGFSDVFDFTYRIVNIKLVLSTVKEKVPF